MHPDPGATRSAHRHPGPGAPDPGATRFPYGSGTISGTTLNVGFSGPLGSCPSGCTGFQLRDPQLGTTFGFYTPPFINNTNSILGTLVTGVLPGENLVLDFDLIESGVARGAPRYMEWYSAFGLLVTLVWLYMEILRLLSKVRDNR